jgi:hypothetical protein
MPDSLALRITACPLSSDTRVRQEPPPAYATWTLLPHSALEDRATTPLTARPRGRPHHHRPPAIAADDDDDLAIIADYVSGSFQASRPGSFLPSVEGLPDSVDR